MAAYRHIQVEFWQDPFVFELSLEEKYFYIYLMTNPKTTQSGVYEISKKMIEIETVLDRKSIDALINKFEEYGKIVYCEETNEIFLKNWIKHNKATSPKVRACIKKEVTKIKSEELLDLFLIEFSKCGYSIDSVYKDYGEKEKEKEKQKEKQKENKNKNIHKKKNEVSKSNILYVDKYANNLVKFKILYEQNVGAINDIVEDWLSEICEEFEVEVFKRAIEIATNKGKLYKGYINGILNQWKADEVRTLDDLISREKSLKDKKGDKYEECEVYRKPTDEEIREFERELEKRVQ